MPSAPNALSTPIETVSDEVLGKIFSYFSDYSEVLALSLVNRRFRGVVASTKRLQYTLLLAKHGMQDGRDSRLSLAERLSLLTRHVAAWNSPVQFSRPTTIFQDARGTPHVYVDGGILAVLDQAETVHLYRLPIPLRGVDLHAFPPWRLHKALRCLLAQDTGNRIERLLLDPGNETGAFLVLGRIVAGYASATFVTFNMRTGEPVPASSAGVNQDHDSLVYAGRLSAGQDSVCLCGGFVMYHAHFPGPRTVGDGSGADIVVVKNVTSGVSYKVSKVFAATFLGGNLFVALCVAPEDQNSSTGPLRVCFMVYELGGRDVLPFDCRLVARLDVPVTVPSFNPDEAFLVGEQVGMPVPRGGLVDETGAFHVDDFAIFRAVVHTDPRVGGVCVGITVPLSVFRDIVSSCSVFDMPVHSSDYQKWSRGSLCISDPRNSRQYGSHARSQRVCGAISSWCDFHPRRVRSAVSVSGVAPQDVTPRFDPRSLYNGHLSSLNYVVHQDNEVNLHLKAGAVSQGSSNSRRCTHVSPLWVAQMPPEVVPYAFDRSSTSSLRLYGDVCVHLSGSGARTPPTEGDAFADEDPKSWWDTVTIYPLCGSETPKTIYVSLLSNSIDAAAQSGSPSPAATEVSEDRSSGPELVVDDRVRKLQNSGVKVRDFAWEGACLSRWELRVSEVRQRQRQLGEETTEVWDAEQSYASVNQCRRIGDPHVRR